MKQTSKLILLLVGFVAASCIVQLAIVVTGFSTESPVSEAFRYPLLNNVDIDGRDHALDVELPLVSRDMPWSVFKPASTAGTPDLEVKHAEKGLSMDPL